MWIKDRGYIWKRKYILFIKNDICVYIWQFLYFLGINLNDFGIASTMLSFLGYRNAMS